MERSSRQRGLDSEGLVFVGLCREYGAAIGRLCAEGGEPPSFEDLARLLSKLHAAVWNLPSPPWNDAEDLDIASYRRALGVPAVYQRLQEVLGVADRYPKIPRGEVVAGEDVEVVVGSLADDLADIYGETVAGIHALDGGANIDRVLWEWKTSFESHWGAHLLDASRQVHRLVTGF